MVAFFIKFMAKEMLIILKKNTENCEIALSTGRSS